MSKDYIGFSSYLPRFFRFLTGKPGETIEPLLLFSVFFLPGYLFQNQEINPLVFNSPAFNGMYLLQTVPSILLTLYILSRKGARWWVPYRITRFRLRDIPQGAVVFFGIWVVLLPFLLLQGLFFPEQAGESVGIDWQLTTPKILPLVAVTSLATGYWEELFFRAYLDGQLKKIGAPSLNAAVAGTVLFAAGHMYEGIVPAVGTGLIGAVLLVAFRRTRSLHTVAIGHGLYNFSVLTLSLFAF